MVFVDPVPEFRPDVAFTSLVRPWKLRYGIGEQRPQTLGVSGGGRG